MGQRLDIHDRSLKAKDTNELLQAYGEWADSYDEDLTGEWGYVAPATTARMLQEALGHTTARVMDAGCGTGLVGEAMAELGFTDIDGLDFSQEMLDRAQEKGVYKRLMRADLNQRLDIERGSYDAVICIGTFTLAHVGPAALDELIRIARPGAPVCFTVRDEWWKASDFATHVEQLEQAGAWQRERLEEIEYVKKEGARCIAALFRTAGQPANH